MGGGMTIFLGMTCVSTKMNINFSKGNEVPNRALKFFPQNPIPAEWKPKNQFWGYIFPYISDSLDRLFPKKSRVHPCVNSHQTCEFHENRFKTATCIVTVIHSYQIFAKCNFFLRNHVMNIKIHHFSIRLRVLNRITVQQKCVITFLHSWLYMLKGFGYTFTRRHMPVVWNFFFFKDLPTFFGIGQAILPRDVMYCVRMIKKY